MSNKYEILIEQEGNVIFSLTFNAEELNLDLLIELIKKIKESK